MMEYIGMKCMAVDSKRLECQATIYIPHMPSFMSQRWRRMRFEQAPLEELDRYRPQCEAKNSKARPWTAVLDPCPMDPV